MVQELICIVPFGGIAIQSRKVTRVREGSNQDLLLCVKTGEYMVFGSIVGSDYYGMAPRIYSKKKR